MQVSDLTTTILMQATT